MFIKHTHIYFNLVFYILNFIGSCYSHTCFAKTEAEPSVKYKSRIIESSHIVDVLNYVDTDGLLVIFDIDNTLIYTGQDIGIEPWFEHLIHEQKALGLSNTEAVDKILPICFEVCKHAIMYPVEAEGSTVLSLLRNKQIPILALTSRSLPLIDITKVHMAQTGFSFESCGPFAKELTIQLKNPLLLSDGIIFCNGNNKGEALMKVLEACNFKPTIILYVDDKLSHHLDVEKVCLLNNIQYIGIRYGKLDSIAAQFDPKRAEQQYIALLGKDYSGKLVQEPIT